MTKTDLDAIKGKTLAIPMLFASGWSFSGDLATGAEYRVSYSSGLYYLYEKTSGSSTWVLKDTATASSQATTVTFEFTEDEQTKSILATSSEANCSVVPLMASDGSVSFNTGYTANYDNASGSDKGIERTKFNWLLRAFSQASYYGQTGIRYTFNVNVSNAIGGYPLGAVLAHDDGTSIRNVVSLVEDNTYNFLTDGVDGIHWKYTDSASSGIFPDYGSSTYLFTADVPNGTSSIERRSEWVEMPIDGWIYIQFNILAGVTTYIVLGPADGSIPEVSLSGDEYTDMIPDSQNTRNYTALLLGNNTYQNKYVLPVKKGTRMAIYGKNESTSAGNTNIGVFVRLYRTVQ